MLLEILNVLSNEPGNWRQEYSQNNEHQRPGGPFLNKVSFVRIADIQVSGNASAEGKRLEFGSGGF